MNKEERKRPLKESNNESTGERERWRERNITSSFISDTLSTLSELNNTFPNQFIAKRLNLISTQSFLPSFLKD